MIFSLPKAAIGRDIPSVLSSLRLAHIEWYSKLGRNPDKNHGMYKIRKLEQIEGVVVPLSNIRQGCMLFPDFTKGVQQGWNSKNILDKCNTFFINNWQSKYTYQTIY